MKRRPTKAEIRDEIEQQVRDFLERGGRIREVEPGVSGYADGEAARSGQFVERPKSSRTPVNDVVASIEARKRPKPSSTTKPLSSKPKKKLLYDDFGEPLRWVWVDE